MEPKVSVGILLAKQINFRLNNTYTVNGKNFTGNGQVTFSEGQIEWDGNKYSEIYLLPVDDNPSFWLRNVVIGINFHWERKEDQQFLGALKFIVENDSIRAINILGAEDYLTSVISSEMSATASIGLLKAHAVISRSWLLAQIEKNKELTDKKEIYSSFTETEDEIIRWYDREDHIEFDVCADDHCQRYQGITRAFSNIETVKQAIAETRGQVLEYNDKICDARFSKCCGGITEEFQNCWEDIKYPYLIKLRDDAQEGQMPELETEKQAVEWIKKSPPAFCNTHDKQILGQVLNNYDQETTDFYRWKITYDQNELSELAKKRSGIDFGIIEELIPIERGTSGRLIKMKIKGTKKTLTIGKELEIRRILSTSHLYSSAFYVKKQGTKFTLYGAGWGHGVGLCQIGAAVMAEKGYTYEKILLHYYRGADLKNLYL